MKKKAWLICTDLDASLLDASYQWHEAEPALEAIRSLGVPLILNSSKTLAEMLPLAAVMDPHAPIIAENGTVLAYPEGADLVEVDGDAEGAYQVNACSMGRSELIERADGLRRKHGYRYVGFSEMGSQSLMELLGLEHEQAEAALDRRSTEPILWESSPEALETFSDALAREGIALVRGGHFQHLMPAGTSKGSALTRILQCYQARNPELDWKTLAIGDSPNDCSMLELADEAIVIPNPKRGTLQLKRPNYRVAEAFGPEGWGTSVLAFITAQLSIATT